ncbi:very short patch repair endonuclease [Streptomyces echinatus]|uniref:very short patch repair endonuclease n=1 Tax=Streptomyces echinatus TaxID=67293 RepID=UPI00382DF8CC
MSSSRQSWASNEQVRAIMRGNRSRDTLPELALRRAIHSRGLRYRVCARPLPGLRRTADLIFTRVKVAVFLDGCFWHGCPMHHKGTSRNSEYWAAKIHRNKARDEDTDRLLNEAGWVVVRVWEHEDPDEAAEKVADIVKTRRSATNPTLNPG